MNRISGMGELFGTLGAADMTPQEFAQQQLEQTQQAAQHAHYLAIAAKIGIALIALWAVWKVKIEDGEHYWDK